MDDRGRLAQPLKPKIKQRNAASRLPQSHAWPVSSSGWRRLAWRWWHALISFQAPRGAGASAAALLLLASASYGAVKGDHVPNIVAQVQDICDATANRAGFGITEIALAGAHEVRRADMLALAGITDRSSLLFLDAAHIRARLLANPWIAEATVLKLYPSQLRIEIKERAPFALWQKDGRVALIAGDGVVLESFVPQRFAALPQVVGKGAEKAAADFLELLARHPDIARLVEASVLVAERRWNLHLKGGLEVLLPESEPARALTTLGDLARERQLLTRDIVAVDLRQADRVTVRLGDAASAARAEALKALDKDKKKKKGSEA
ncbi:MAG: FtsQ-type POTRA domain-containing protein [Rhizobiales bacterium]|nr:FtsQ-type POTRA domain-containing protein [Hyphomicrobiales bacterium]